MEWHTNFETWDRRTSADNPICRMFDRVLDGARHYFWLAMPWYYYDAGKPADNWLKQYTEKIIEKHRTLKLHTRILMRPPDARSPRNSVVIERLTGSGIHVTLSGAKGLVRHLHAKMVLSDSAVAWGSANLTPTDLYRNPNQMTVSTDPRDIAKARELFLMLELGTKLDPKGLMGIMDGLHHYASVTGVCVDQSRLQDTIRDHFLENTPEDILNDLPPHTDVPYFDCLEIDVIGKTNETVRVGGRGVFEVTVFSERGDEALEWETSLPCSFVLEMTADLTRVIDEILVVVDTNHFFNE